MPDPVKATVEGPPLPVSVWQPDSVAEILDRASNAMVFIRADGSERTTSYAALKRDAKRIAGGLRRRARRGDRIVLRLTDPESLLAALWACLLDGFVPVLGAPRHAERFAAPCVVSRIDDLRAAEPADDCVPGSRDDVALLMLTSGSSGAPKAVRLTHTNVVASIAASAYVNGYTANDRSLNWLPLHHIGALMRSLRETYLDCAQIQVATSRITEDPLRWLDLISDLKATLTWGPNSAFASVVARSAESHPWSLASLRSVYSSGEPVISSTMRRFAAMLSPHGLREGVLHTAWGMTEACFATYSHDVFDRLRPAPGVSLRVAGDSEPGPLQIRGPLVAAGYENASSDSISSDGWFDTGDLAIIRDGFVTIAGRSKEIVKIGGIAFANHEIESAIRGVAISAAVGVSPATGESDALAVFFGAEDNSARIHEIRAQVVRDCGIAPRFVIPLAADQFPRGAIGKIQRATLRDAFEGGVFDSCRRWPYDLRAAPPRNTQRATAKEQERAQHIATILSEVLGIPIGLEDDMFAAGASSLRVVEAAARMECEVADLFHAPAPLALAIRLERHRGAHLPAARRSRTSEEPIAIVGMSCRFPGARNVDEFWNLLRDGRDALTQFTDADLISAGVERRMLHHPSYVRAGMVLEEIESFDADFFGISAAEADLMDPQQRLLLECGWEALEDAGLAPARGARAAVYVGARMSDYMFAEDLRPELFGEDSIEGFQRLLGNDKDYLATRLAYLLDLRGPAVTVQTACSTSLVAVHMACRSLGNHESDIALAGAASIRVPHRAGYLHSAGMIFSPDGHTRPFDARAAGTVFGSGGGVVVLKRLSDAVADGDSIAAVIRGSAINNDGAGPKAAFTAPNLAGQSRVIADALAAANVDPRTITYIEAHGTGTAVGDPIEVAALSEALHGAESCAIGSVKGNIGHLIQAAGIAGLIKTALMLRHRTIVPAANFDEPNPLINFAATPFAVNTTLRDWPAASFPRRAGVSAFGFGGTNAHVVLEEPPAIDDLPSDARSEILPLAAKSPAALNDLVQRYAQVDAQWDRVCATAQTGRAHFDHRVAIVGASWHAPDREGVRVTRRPRVAFVFSGQGSQYAAMGRRLYQTRPLFRSAFDECDVPFLAEGDLDRTDLAQPAIVALQIALTTLWRSWGIEPDVVLGHSLGEIAAAWAAGIISRDDAIRFAGARGRLMERQAGDGAMAVVFAGPEVVGNVSIAAINNPEQTVISGTRQNISCAVRDLAQRGIASRVLSERHAFHSSLMDPILEELETEAWRMRFSSAQTNIITMIGGDMASPEYWRRQARETVDYAAAIRSVDCDVTLEIGPDAVLATNLSSLRRGHDELEQMLASLGRLYELGADIDWRAVADDGRRKRRVALPTYPFQRRRHWVTKTPRVAERPRDIHPLIGAPVPSPLPDKQFRADLTAGVAPYARDHWVYGVRPLVIVGQLEMLRAAANASSDARGHTIVEDVVVEQPLLLDDRPRHVQTTVAPDGSARIFSSEDEHSWLLHTSARVRMSTAGPEPRIDLDAIRARCESVVHPADIYAHKRARGANIGPAFEVVQRAWRGRGELLAEAQVAETIDARYFSYPGLLDASAQCAELTAGDFKADSDPLFLPTVVERATFYDRFPERIWLHLRARDRSSDEIYGVDCRVCDDSGRVLASIDGLFFKRATPATLRGQERSEMRLLDVRWIPIKAPAALDCAGEWLILADEGGRGDALAQQIVSRGGACIIVRRGDGFRRSTKRFEYTIAADCEDDFQRIARDVRARIDTGMRFRGAVHCWSLDIRPDAAPMDAARFACGSALSLVKALLSEDVAAERAPSLWLVTRGAQTTGLETAPLAAAQAPLWGFGRAVDREQPQFGCRCIDLDPAGGDVLLSAMHVDQTNVCIRGATLQVMRCDPATSAAVPQAYRVEPGAARTVDALRTVPATRRSPHRHEVEIEVFATGLNFRDVLNATGRIDGPFGYECSGVVVAHGAAVTALPVGTPVMALAPNAFASHVTVDARLVVRKPPSLSFAAAAAQVVAFLTAEHAFRDVAKLRAGERVLIHAAAGGVGQAAVRIAQATGATVVASASASKQDLVRAHGVDEIVDSRHPGFSRNTPPVDVLLNVLGAEFMNENIAVLKRGGRLVELGHPAVFNVGEERKRAAAAGLQFTNFHIAQDVAPDDARALLGGIVEAIECGRVTPLPHRTFLLSEIGEAFEMMLRGAHVGKLVITHPAMDRLDEVEIRPDATYLVTGGTGAVGTHIAEWLAARGAQHIALLARNARPSAIAQARFFTADVADFHSVREALAKIEATMPPVRGVVHAAGVLDDSVVSNQTWPRFENVLAAKVTGASNLDRLLSNRPLDFFVLISSVAGLRGNGGQSAYAAANAYLDQLAHARRQRGLPALSINYGAWRGCGMASAAPSVGRRREEIEPADALHALQTALARGRAQVAAGISTEETHPDLSLRETEAQTAATPPRTLEEITERVQHHVAGLAGANDIDLRIPLPQLGLDSLALLLLRGRIVADIGDAGALPVIRFLEGHSAAELASMIHERSERRDEKRWTSLMALRKGNGLSPFFLVPAAAQSVLRYRDFVAAFDDERPVYGLNPVGLDGNEPHDSIELMARHYIREIVSMQPHGPYLIGGVCFGAHVAFEMARQLKESGRDVPVVVAIDTSAPAGVLLNAPAELSKFVIRRANYYVERVLYHLRNRSFRRSVAARLKSVMAERAHDPADAAPLHRLVEAHAIAHRSYRARPYCGDLLFVQSGEVSPLKLADRWNLVTGGHVSTVTIPGATHGNLIDEYGADVARIVSERLRSAAV